MRSVLPVMYSPDFLAAQPVRMPTLPAYLCYNPTMGRGPYRTPRTNRIGDMIIASICSGFSGHRSVVDPVESASYRRYPLVQEDPTVKRNPF